MGTTKEATDAPDSVGTAVDESHIFHAWAM